MKLGFENKVALVTGGNSGIGRAIAMAFAEEGAKVVIAARDEAKGKEVVDLIKKTGGQCTFVKTDVAKPADVKAMVQKTIDTYGRLDCAVNNAGIEPQNFFIDAPEEEWDQIMNLNLKGTWMCMKHEIPHMLKLGRGAIVNISSVGGLMGIPKNSIYCASKHGLHALAKTASVELVSQGVRVNTVCPGLIETPTFWKAVDTPEQMALAKTMIPIGRFGTPEEIAGAVVFLCSDRASFISGITLSIDGGFSQH